MSDLKTGPCCGHHLASHDWHEDGWGHQGCGHRGCRCPNTFTEAMRMKFAPLVLTESD